LRAAVLRAGRRAVFFRAVFLREDLRAAGDISLLSLGDERCLFHTPDGNASRNFARLAHEFVTC
jgi:hypothetical protein